MKIKKSTVILLLSVIILLLVSIISLLGYIMFFSGNKTNNENSYSEIKITETTAPEETQLPETSDTVISTSTVTVTTTANITTVADTTAHTATVTVTESITAVQTTTPPATENITQPVREQNEQPVQEQNEQPVQNQEQEEQHEEPAHEQNEQPAPQPVYEELEPQKSEEEMIYEAIIEALDNFTTTDSYRNTPIHNFGLYDMNYDGIPELFIRAHQGDSQSIHYYLYVDGKYQKLYENYDACRISEEYGMIVFIRFMNTLIVTIGDDGYIESERIVDYNEGMELLNMGSWYVPWEEGSEF